MYSLSPFFPISSFARGKAKQLADRSDLIPFFLSPMDSESTPGVWLTSDPPFFHSCWAYTYLFLLFLLFLLSQLLIHLCSALTDWTRSRGFGPLLILCLGKWTGWLLSFNPSCFQKVKHIYSFRSSFLSQGKLPYIHKEDSILVPLLHWTDWRR